MTLWYLARAAGVMALLALTLSTALGAFTSGNRGRAGIAVIGRFHLQRLHLGAAVTALTLLGLHLTALVVDANSGVSAQAVLVPLAASYRPLAVALGVLALYTIVGVSLLGAARGRMAASASLARRWRVLHGLAYGGWLLAIGHGITAGTDTTTQPMLWVYAGCVLTVGLAVVVRLFRESQHEESPLTSRRRSAGALTKAGR